MEFGPRGQELVLAPPCWTVAAWRRSDFLPPLMTVAEWRSSDLGSPPPEDEIGSPPRRRNLHQSLIISASPL
ncbi:hypothetical protein TIFTF001_012073 [Ficus carica]|uniref:Uncharacterized protein n=1 Tax=Ficus carica TaxID=3494 RepID=A0AA87ZVD0_FICCA|nr:hypothetical protein TIFTF001_012073 [Ficus carica]